MLALTVIISYVVNYFVLGQAITPAGLWSDIIAFGRSWYLNMYVGILLLIPFFNILWRNLEETSKKVLIVILMLLTSLTSITDVPLPNYWIGLYPITYYFCGAFLRENRVAIKKAILLASFIFVTLMQTVFTITYSAGGIFDWNVFGNYQCSYNAFIVAVSTILLFCILQDVRIKNRYISSILDVIGKNTLGIYLASTLLVDNLLYPFFQERYLTAQSFAQVQIFLAIASFVLSTVISIILTSFIKKCVLIFRPAHIDHN